MEVHDTTLKVTGHNAQLLVDQLDYYTGALDLNPPRSAKAKSHFLAAGNAGVEIKLSATGGVCEATGSEVTLDWGECNNDVKYLGETAIFEVQNALNNGAYKDITRKTNKYEQSLLEHGLAYAMQESQSSQTLAAVLTQLPATGTHAYTPTAFGKGHKQAVQAHVADFPQYFADQVHDPKPASQRQNVQDGLKSKFLYVYDYITLKVSRGSSFKAHLPKIEQSGLGGLSSSDLADLASNKLTNYGSLSSHQLFVSLIYALKAIKKSGKVLRWNEDTRTTGTWVQCADDFCAVLGLSKTLKVSELKADLSGTVSAW